MGPHDVGPARHARVPIAGPIAAGAALGGRESDYRGTFESVHLAGRATCADCMPYESDVPGFVCRRITRPLSMVWPRLKRYE